MRRPMSSCRPSGIRSVACSIDPSTCQSSVALDEQSPGDEVVHHVDHEERVALGPREDARREPPDLLGGFAPRSARRGTPPRRRARGARGSRRTHCPFACSSCCTTRSGWSCTIRSAGRRLPITISRPAGGGGRCTRSGRRSSGSLHCRSSSTSTRARSLREDLERVGHLAQHARRRRGDRRSARAPAVGRCSSAGSCDTHVGACCCSTSRARAPRRRAARPPSASSTGRYASPSPYCSRHCPRAISARLPCSSSSTKRSISVVLPIPASPVTNTICGAPASACSNAARSSARSFARPTTHRRRSARRRRRPRSGSVVRDEAVALAPDRLDVAGRVGVVAERFANRAHRDLQHRLRHVRAGPEPVR